MQPLTLDHQARWHSAVSHDVPDYNFGMGDASKHTRSQAAQAAQTRPYAILNPFNNQLHEATRVLSTINCKPQWNCITHRRNQEHGCGQSNANRNPQSSNPMEQRSQISLPIDRVLNFAWAMCRGTFDRKPCKPHPSHKPGSPHRRREMRFTWKKRLRRFPTFSSHIEEAIWTTRAIKNMDAAVPMRFASLNWICAWRTHPSASHQTRFPTSTPGRRASRKI